jgi:uncharacterized membrane protein YphA (DoxX/SURF4 family)
MPRARTLARTFYGFCAVLSSAALLRIALGSLGASCGSTLCVSLFHILVYRGWIVIGTSVSAAILTLVNAASNANSRASSPAIREFITSADVLKGICLSVSLAFIGTEIGKLTHAAEMREFFVQSGYAVWFLYFVIICETLGSIALFISRVRVAAATCLTILMIGAILTHVHNGDPFSDSLEAVHLLILLACIIVICLLQPTAAAKAAKQS